MNRAECEAKLEALMREAWEVYKQYNPEGEYLTMSINDGVLSINNAYWAEDAEKKVSIFDYVEETEEGAEQ